MLNRGILTLKSAPLTLFELYMQNSNKAYAELNKLIRDDVEFNNKNNRFDNNYCLIFDSFDFYKDDALFQSEKFLFNICDFKVSKNKRIIKNKLNMDENTIKEYVGSDDYVINFSGFLVDFSYNSKPIELFESFCEIMNANASIPVVCELLNRIDINNIIVESFGFDSNYASKNTLPFSFSASSDNTDYKIFVS